MRNPLRSFHVLDANEQSGQPSNQSSRNRWVSPKVHAHSVFRRVRGGGRSKLGRISPLYGECRTSLCERDTFSMSLAAHPGQTLKVALRTLGKGPAGETS